MAAAAAAKLDWLSMLNWWKKEKVVFHCFLTPVALTLINSSVGGVETASASILRFSFKEEDELDVAEALLDSMTRARLEVFEEVIDGTKMQKIVNK